MTKIGLQIKLYGEQNELTEVSKMDKKAVLQSVPPSERGFVKVNLEEVESKLRKELEECAKSICDWMEMAMTDTVCNEYALEQIACITDFVNSVLRADAEKHCPELLKEFDDIVAEADEILRL